MSRYGTTDTAAVSGGTTELRPVVPETLRAMTPWPSSLTNH